MAHVDLDTLTVLVELVRDAGCTSFVDFQAEVTRVAA
jgi:hypothetical protein